LRDPAFVSTSYVERSNLTMRMQNRRFTRLTNAFSKKFENHMHMVALYTCWYNFIRVHKTLKMSSEMAAGVVVNGRSLRHDGRRCAEARPGGPYKKRGTEALA
jgi:hypothetical protein